MQKFIIKNIKLVSANKRISKTKKDRFCLGAEYRKCRELLTAIFLQQKKETYKENLFVKIRISKEQWRGDIDNCIKIILDTLQSACVIENDKNIKRLEIHKVDFHYSWVIVDEIKK